MAGVEKATKAILTGPCDSSEWCIVSAMSGCGLQAIKQQGAGQTKCKQACFSTAAASCIYGVIMLTQLRLSTAASQYSIMGWIKT